MLVEFECPACKGHLCERWALNGSNVGIRLMYWHYMLNPGLAFNELVLGQRMPAQMFICKSCTLPMADRSYVHCPECDLFHAGRSWSYKNAFGNWLGYVCPSCGGVIPCLWNLTSRVFLTLSAPIWWLPVQRSRVKWIQQKHKLIAQTHTAYIDKALMQPKPINYQRVGWFWALCMDLFFALGPLIAAASTHQYTVPALLGVYLMAVLTGLCIWLPAGWLFGFVMKRMLDKPGDQSLHLRINSDGAIVPASFAQIEDTAEDMPRIGGI